MTSPGDDDAQPCIAGQQHVWAWKGLHLSLVRGAESEEECGRCGGLRYVSTRGGRPASGRQPTE